MKVRFAAMLRASARMSSAGISQSAAAQSAVFDVPSAAPVR